MTKTYRIRTTPGDDKNIRININQDFDFLEILSLKLRQDDVYTRFCADYGVVVGRVITNGGYGIPNANVSVFVPLSAEDETDPVISTLYPYKSIEQKNEDGYRYNLLPYRKEFQGHTPTGTFPDREDVLTRKEVLEVYEKYYKYTVKTNESGDFMIIGVPLGIQTIMMDLDLSNIGCFSLSPSDLIRLGRGGSGQFNGNQFKSSTDLDSLPQIVNQKKDINVSSFWGEQEICDIGITRVDFDLRDLGIEIKPQAIFMGSVFSNTDEDFLRTNCKPKKDAGKLCDLVSAEGTILAIRQTIDYDSKGRPILEQFSLPEGGKIIDENGTWLTEVPMNLDYIITNEFGEQVISNDPSIGVPTKGKYRFRIQYQNENGTNNQILRADYLVPNVKEWGWNLVDENKPTDLKAQKYSYAFSLDWEEYGDLTTSLGSQMVQEAINCEDRFYEFNYNKVYTIAGFIDRWKWGKNRGRHLGIKEITDRACTTTNNRFPVNDGVRNFDFINFLFNLILSILTFPIIIIITLLHVLALLWPILRVIINIFIWLINQVFDIFCWMGNIKIAKIRPFKKLKKFCDKPDISPLPEDNPFKRISLPMMSFPDCEACPCEDGTLEEEATQTQNSLSKTIENTNLSILADLGFPSTYNYNVCDTPGFTCDDPDSQNEQFKELFSGFVPDGPDCFIRLKKLPITKYPAYQLGFDVTLAQSLNLLNVKFSYFVNTAPNLNGYPKLGGNIITYKTVNANPTTNLVEESNTIYDQPLIILCDAGTLSQLGQGKLLSFYNPKNNNDPNISGFTKINQFNTTAITGTTPFNPSTLVEKPITFIQPDGTVINTTIKCKITEKEKQYVHSAGIEYFQVITGGTVAQFQSLVSNNNGPLYNYIFNKRQSVVYSLNNVNKFSLIGVNSMSSYEGSEDLEILILTRGVDPYTQKQKIKYDLSKLFGYGVNGGNITVEGDYYLNIPIQPNTGSIPTNTSWRYDQYSPESHNIINNTNISLYHEPFGFTLDQTLFTAFTSNNPHYYNSTDKSQSNFKAYPTSDCELLTLGNYTINGEGYESLKPNETNNNSMLFEYSAPSLSLIYSQNFGITTPNGWSAQIGGWNLSDSVFGNPCTGTHCMSINVLGGTPNKWAFTNGISMTAGKSYKMKFKQKTIIPMFSNGKHNLKITVGAGQTPEAQTTDIFILTNSNNIACNNLTTNDFNCTVSGVYNFGFFCYSESNSGYLIIDDIEIYEVDVTYSTQGRFEGGTFMGSKVTPASSFYDDGYQITNNYSLTKNQPRLYSPAYHTTNPSDITITNNNRLVFRSDRLPTSDKTEILGNSSLSLHLNDNFNFYLISDNGESQGIAVANNKTAVTDQTGNLSDFTEDTTSQTSAVLESLTCEGMVPLKCYDGGGTNFKVLNPCEDNQMGKKKENKRVDGGCYFFVDNKLLASLPKDIASFFEWRARYRVVFAACRGVFSHVFQNNWVNGTLYMFAFKKQTIFNIIGKPKKYLYCGSLESSSRPGQGPIYYTEGTTNSFFYRATPYNGNKFVGQIPKRKKTGTLQFADYGGMNDRNLFFPTTIMDLGPRDEFTKEICTSPTFEGYFIDTLLSTSYKDTSDLLSLFFISRMVNSNFWSQALSLGDASIGKMFSRTEQRIDGDLAQLFSINSEYGVDEFDNDLYDDNDIYISDGSDIFMGVFFTSNTINRKVVSPGVLTFNSSLSYTFGYPKTQEVPFYKWGLNGGNTIFGLDTNEWVTNISNGGFYSQKYQDLSFDNSPLSPYFNNSIGGRKGFIFNSNNGTNDPQKPGGLENKFIVGAPYHFYFGLNKGKSAINRYITKYIINKDV